MNKNRIILFCGLPGSGKSTWLSEHPDSSNVILSSDDFRKVITGGQDFYAPLEEIVWFCVKNAARVLIVDHSVVIDATSLTVGSRNQWIRIAQDAGVEIDCYVFNTRLDICKERNAQRERFVPDDVMDRMAEQFELPAEDEGFTGIYIMAEG